MKNSATGDFLSVERIEKNFVVTTSKSNFEWNWIPSDGQYEASYPTTFGSRQGDCRKEPRRDPLCTKTKINQNS